MISLADSQILRWVDSLNGIADADAQAKEIKAEIRMLRKELGSLQNRRKIKKLYEQLDAIQFKPDYMCLIIDRERDYIRACSGFMVNGIKYRRLLGTNGGVKNKTIVFVSERLHEELNRRIDNGRNMEQEMVPAKLEAYKALTCSASTPVSMPNGILVVNDCETEFLSDIIYINDESDGEPIADEQENVLVNLNESDGYGIMLPSLAARWAQEIGIDYIPGGVNTRFAWEKGMVFCFDFLDFANTVANKYIVKDAWGDWRDIRGAELILTTSMLKLWNSYNSFEEYIGYCTENEYQFGIAKVCPKVLECERNLNYQFIQSYELSDSDIEELIAPTMNEIKDILFADYQKTILFLKGAGLNEQNVDTMYDDYVKALMIDQRMLNDPYIQSKIFTLIKNRINEAKVGAIKVHGNYSAASGDPYSLCQSIFNLEVTGLLKAGEIYNAYWADIGADKLVCFRAPMTCHNNIRAVTINRSQDIRRWYRYMDTCTVFNSWDTAAHALNGMDKDGDLVMLTDNRVLVDNLRPLPALICVQRKAQKKLVREEDLIRATIDSFGDDIGKTTNRITAMFETQSRHDIKSDAYRVLDYRIKCGQLFQQNAIDKTKGIISKQMPREWYDRHRAALIEDPKQRQLYMSILADKKPYFMRYIYPDLMRQYNTYIKNANRKAQREFNICFDEMLKKYPDDLGEQECDFIRYYHKMMPVGTGDCVVNKICRRFEQEFDGYISRRNTETGFNYTIMKSAIEYSHTQLVEITRLLNEYKRKLKDYKIFSYRERIDCDEATSHSITMREELRAACDTVCSNAECLCNILLDLCYQRSNTKQFVWSVCGEEIIDNLLQNNNSIINFPELDQNGDIEFRGNRFVFKQKKIGVDK